MICSSEGQAVLSMTGRCRSSGTACANSLWWIIHILGVFIPGIINKTPLLNQDWFLRVPSSIVTFLPSGISDHAPVLLSVASYVAHNRHFRYLNCWASSPDFVDCVSRGWSSPSFGGKIYTLFSKLRRIRDALKRIHYNQFSVLAEHVAAAKARLSDCQTLLQATPICPLLLTQERQFLAAYFRLKSAEMSALAQRAKVQHLTK
ncbi:hypothetical protein RND81_08G068900 [Saponaria officinalis]|uniref:Reverse transcriptase n=1 Tax=Saponaria officinalis TaxID=3572 RepID=A0AAW1J5M6_SAPOF